MHALTPWESTLIPSLCIGMVWLITYASPALKTTWFPKLLPWICGFKGVNVFWAIASATSCYSYTTAHNTTPMYTLLKNILVLTMLWFVSIFPSNHNSINNAYFQTSIHAFLRHILWLNHSSKSYVIFTKCILVYLCPLWANILLSLPWIFFMNEFVEDL